MQTVTAETGAIRPNPPVAAQRRIRQGPSRSYMSTDLAASYDDAQPVSCPPGPALLLTDGGSIARAARAWTDTFRERRRALLR
jgi:hypothetical protein